MVLSIQVLRLDAVFAFFFYTQFTQTWRHGGLMVSALDSRSSSPGLSPGQGHRVVFLGQKLYPRSASLHPGV